MFFTSVEIDPDRRASRAVLASPHRLHGAVTRCFPASLDLGRVLWRVDERTDATVLYVLSATEPNLAEFIERHGREGVVGRTRDYGSVLDAVAEGRRFQFRLRANPVHNVRIDKSSPDGNSGRTKRIAHVTVAQQRKWFVDRAARWGLSVGGDGEATVDVVDRRLWNFSRAGRTVTLGTATFEGELAVTEPAQLRRQLVDGFGPAKAYGCGLMTLAPPAS